MKEGYEHRYITEKDLRQLYWNEGYTMEEIGDIYDITKERVHQIMDNYGIKTRNQKLQEKLTEQELRRLYIEEGMTQVAIANKLEIHINTLRKYLRKYEISFRQGHTEKTKRKMSRAQKKIKNLGVSVRTRETIGDWTIAELEELLLRTVVPKLPRNAGLKVLTEAIVAGEHEEWRK